MVTQSRIDAALDAFTGAIAPHIGRGKTLGAQEVADDTAGPEGGLSAETIHNYCKGVTTPGMDWLMRFVLAYDQRFPSIVDNALNAYFAASCRRVSRIDCGGPAFLDANGDGRVDVNDQLLHANALGRLQAERSGALLKGADVRSPEMQANQTELQRHLDALAELARTAFPRVARTG